MNYIIRRYEVIPILHECNHESHEKQFISISTTMESIRDPTLFMQKLVRMSDGNQINV